MKWADATAGVGYLAVVAVVEEAQARRVGCSVGVLRCLMRVAALRETGAAIGVRDLARAGLGHASRLRDVVAEGVAAGLLMRADRRGALDLTSAGRAVVAETVRAWERSRRLLVHFEPCGPFRRTGPK